MQLFARKSVDHLITEATERRGLKRALGKLELTMLGIGAIVGAGIFSSVGTAEAGSADPPGAGPALSDPNFFRTGPINSSRFEKHF